VIFFYPELRVISLHQLLLFVVGLNWERGVSHGLSSEKHARDRKADTHPRPKRDLN
jgi:hypothetical protein